MTPARVSVYNKSMEKDPSRARPQPSAQKKMMDILARRDHSEKEIRQKLKDKFTPEEIDRAIDLAKEKGWIPNSTESLQALSEETAAMLRRKGKGPLYIERYLEERGMPPVKGDASEELEKAQELAHNKFSDIDKMDQKEKAKVGRFLISRGFSLETVRKVIYEKF
jgi:regulatory protein